MRTIKKSMTILTIIATLIVLVFFGTGYWELIELQFNLNFLGSNLEIWLIILIIFQIFMIAPGIIFFRDKKDKRLAIALLILAVICGIFWFIIINIVIDNSFDTGGFLTVDFCVALLILINIAMVIVSITYLVQIGKSNNSDNEEFSNTVPTVPIENNYSDINKLEAICNWGWDNNKTLIKVDENNLIVVKKNRIIPLSFIKKVDVKWYGYHWTHRAHSMWMRGVHIRLKDNSTYCNC